MKYAAHLPALLALLAAASGAQAQTSFNERRLEVAGNHDIDATAINIHGDITASVFDTSGNIQSGIILKGHAVTTLPIPYKGSAVPMPQAINDRGDVLGYAYESIQPHHVSAARRTLRCKCRCHPGH